MGRTVAIIGDGAMATICSLLAAEKGYGVRMWGAFPQYVEELRRTRENRKYLPGAHLPDCVELTADGAQAFEGAFLIVSAVPCQYLRGVWTRLLAHAPRTLPIVSITKGIEVKTLLRPTQVIRNVLGAVPVVALSGPNIASELAKKLPATVTAACEDLKLAERVQEVFSTGWFRVYTNDDVVGVELAAAMKNVIALAAGGLDGMGVGCNAKAALLTRGLAEIARLGIAMGAERETFAGLSGLGDLVTTCISPASRNRTAGEKMGRGMTLQEVTGSTNSVVEGIPTTQAVVQLARQYGVRMPITEAMHAVLFEGKNAHQAITEPDGPASSSGKTEPNHLTSGDDGRKMIRPYLLGRMFFRNGFPWRIRHVPWIASWAGKSSGYRYRVPGRKHHLYAAAGLMQSAEIVPATGGAAPLRPARPARGLCPGTP